MHRDRSMMVDRSVDGAGDAVSSCLTLPELVASRAHSDAPFIIPWCEDSRSEPTTFRHFAGCVGKAVAELAAQGVARGEFVGVLAHNSVDFWSMCMGIVCHGAVCVLLNHRQPTDVVAAMATAAGVTRMVTTPSLLTAARNVLRATAGILTPMLVIALEDAPSTCAGSDVVAVTLQVAMGQAPAQGSIERWPSLDPTDAALCFFTSGSTGTPKPVVHSHATILWARQREEAWLRSLGLLGPGPHSTGLASSGAACREGMLSFGPGFHVLGFCMTFLGALHAGVRFIDDGASHLRPMTAPLLARACEAARPSLASVAVVHIERLASCLHSGQCTPHQLASLRALLWGGATLPRHLPASLAAEGVQLLATYGQTETAGYVLGGQLGDLTSPLAMAPIAPEVEATLVLPEDSDLSAASSSHSTTVKDPGSSTSLTGELVLRGCASAVRPTRGKIGCLRTAVTSSDPHCTSDLFNAAKLQDCDPRWSDKDPQHRVPPQRSRPHRVLEHRCRVDDLLVHTSGEMTNPCVLESLVMSAASDQLACICVLGNGMVRPLAVVETHEHIRATDPSHAAAVAAAICAANQGAPPYSWLHPAHVILVDRANGQPALERTAKGNPKRADAERRMASVMRAILAPSSTEGLERAAAAARCTLGWLKTYSCENGAAYTGRGLGDNDDETTDEERSAQTGGQWAAVGSDSLSLHAGRPRQSAARGAPDSLSAVAQPGAAADAMATKGGDGVVISHVYLACMTLVILHHLTKVREACAKCGVGFAAAELFGEAVAMPAFAIIAGVRDRALRSSTAVWRVAVHTALLLGSSLLVAHYTSLAERVWWFYRYLVYSTNKGLLKAPSREYFHMHEWFMVALPVWRLTHATLRSMRLRAVLPPLALAIHFGCWGTSCRWPFLRHPHELEASVASLGYFGGSQALHALASSLPQNDLSVVAPYFIFYAAVPAILPARFPAVLPLEGLANTLRRCGPTEPRRARQRQACARRLWQGIVLGILALCVAAHVTAASAPVTASGTAMASWMSRALYHSKRAYGCNGTVFPPRQLVVRTDELQPCGPKSAGGWSVGALLLDLSGVAFSTVAVRRVPMQRFRCPDAISGAQTACMPPRVRAHAIRSLRRSQVVGVAAAVPRAATSWTFVGSQTLSVYLLHLYVLPAVDMPLAAIAQATAYFVHPEAALISALVGSLIVIRALALPLPSLMFPIPCASPMGWLAERLWGVLGTRGHSSSRMTPLQREEEEEPLV